jgi:murein DD-endopeptidase MepM/ murein hydrolase activator NlpD
MPRLAPPRRLLSRLALAAAGVFVLAVGLRLTSGGGPAGATSLSIVSDTPPLTDASVPADYVPDEAVSPAPPTIDPLAAADAPDLAGGEGAPLDFIKVTSGFGMRRHPILGFSRMHQGVDFAAREGAPVLAAADGEVTEAGWAGGYGRLLRIKHAGGWATGYAHLSRFAPGVEPGARVDRGQVVGFVGRTGLATGPHLHFEVVLNGRHVDPMQTPFGGVREDDPHTGAYGPTFVRLRLRGPLRSDTPAV